jgi:hypothetical protein
MTSNNAFELRETLLLLDRVRRDATELQILVARQRKVVHEARVAAVRLPPLSPVIGVPGSPGPEDPGFGEQSGASLGIGPDRAGEDRAA